MLGALLAPEYILAIAFEEWISGCEGLKKVLGKFRETVLK